MKGIMIELILWTDNADVSIEEISQSIGIFPVECELIGEIKRYGGRIVDASSLLWSTDYVDTLDVEIAIKKMIKIIEPRWEQIANVVKQYDMNAKVCIVIDVQEKPIITIPSDFVELMAQISAEIEFDTYFDCIWNDEES